MSAAALELDPASSPSAESGGRRTANIAARVVAARWESAGVTSFEVVQVDGHDLPAWAAGAHIDVQLPSGTTRQYSLCGDPGVLTSYRFAVLELPHGRGGSIEAHRELRPGVEITIGRPRQNFALVEAARYVFVAGGIGITPLLPMIREAAHRGADWVLLYGARSSEHFTFRSELRALGENRIRFIPADIAGRPDLAEVARSSAGAAVYCCGPAPLMDELTTQMTRTGHADDLHLERFVPAPGPPTSPGADEPSDRFETFEVELASSGQVIDVGPGQTILEAIRSAGVDHPSSCEMGICGTCETKVLAGEVDHRDELLTEAERATGCTMMVCVSRARCARLVLDA